MKKYSSLTDKLLNRKPINESFKYPDDIEERMHSQIEQDLINGLHSLTKHPIFPSVDDSSFEKKLIMDRFQEVVKRYKRYHDVDYIENDIVKKNISHELVSTFKLEQKYVKELVKLAEEMVREEFDVDASIVEIHAELVPKINLEGAKLKPKSDADDFEFKDHKEMENIKKEIQKRRFINAMIQGASKKTHNIFHMFEDNLMNIDHKLLNIYSKLMSSADYMYFISPSQEAYAGGSVHVQFPKNAGDKSKIYAQGVCLPVLIHELVKGMMELISANGLPKNKRIGQYIIDKADYLEAEIWDMRLGPELWTKFVNKFDISDYKLKHHVYADLVSLPVTEFNHKMREILSDTKESKKIIQELIDNVKNDFKMDEIEPTQDTQPSQGYSFDELGLDISEEENTGQNGYSFDELMSGLNPSKGVDYNDIESFLNKPSDDEDAELLSGL